MQKKRTIQQKPSRESLLRRGETMQEVDFFYNKTDKKKPAPLLKAGSYENVMEKQTPSQ